MRINIVVYCFFCGKFTDNRCRKLHYEDHDGTMETATLQRLLALSAKVKELGDWAKTKTQAEKSDLKAKVKRH